MNVRGRAPSALLVATAILAASTPFAPAAAGTDPRAANSAAPGLADPGCGELAIPLKDGTTVYRLARTFIAEGSDSAWTTRGALERGRGYLLDPVRGEVRLLGMPATGDTLFLRACWLIDPPPVDLQLNTYRPVLPDAPDSAETSAHAAVPRPSTRRAPSVAPAGASLVLSGNKTLAVDFGSSQDAALRQSLDLTVSGTLAPGVEIAGVLTDRNTPLTAGGATQDLQSLDRVLVEVRGPAARATLGDITLDASLGTFGRVQRRLQGVQGEWTSGPLGLSAAAASAAGEYHRVQFFGSEGRQGPYTLTDRDGAEGVAIVAESELVTLDGERMVRGERADYAIDYERAQVTFSNRRPITFASRITIEYQYTVNRFRRNLVAAGGRWAQGPWQGFAQLVSEGDDRGRPLDALLSPEDRVVLQFAGDSASRALGAGVTAGGGDYDTVRVAGELVFAYAGPDSGAFEVRFARLADGGGDYVDSTIVEGRSVFRYAGAGLGTHAVGRGLPLPESRQIWSIGGGVREGAFSADLEGAVSRLDRNTFSPLDDEDNSGFAGRLRTGLEGDLSGPLPGRAGIELDVRSVGERFRPLSRIERAFAEEDWGLPIGADIERQDRAELTSRFAPKAGGEFTAHAGRLTTPFGFAANRGGLAWRNQGAVGLVARWDRSESRQAAMRFDEGGRERAFAELRLRTPWAEPALRVESDERRFPSDSGRVGDRFRELGLELAAPRAVAWRARIAGSLRRDAVRTAAGFADRSDARTARLSLEAPAGRAIGGGADFHTREVVARDGSGRTRSDLASLRLTLEDRARGLRANTGLEITAEGEPRRVRTVVFVGPGAGAYDALGNFVGTGDYDLRITVAPDLDRIARSAASARVAWTFGASDLWRGSRVGFDFESEARRRGAWRAADGLLAPGAVLHGAALARGSVLQRLESELAPASPAAALRLRLERRVSADRAFTNFAQTLDERLASGRWRLRPSVVTSAELEVRHEDRRVAQAVTGGSTLERAIRSNVAVAQFVYTPGPHLRIAAAGEGTWARERATIEGTRTLRVGPDVGLSVGARGRVETMLRRAFVSGALPISLLPSADPAGAPRWDGSVRFDYRLRESTTVALTYAVRERAGRGTESNGRAELRAFF